MFFMWILGRGEEEEVKGTEVMSEEHPSHELKLCLRNTHRMS